MNYQNTEGRQINSFIILTHKESGQAWDGDLVFPVPLAIVILTSFWYKKDSLAGLIIREGGTLGSHWSTQKFKRHFL